MNLEFEEFRKLLDKRITKVIQDIKYLPIPFEDKRERINKITSLLAKACNIVNEMEDLLNV